MEKPIFHYGLFYFIYIYLDEMSKIQSLLPCSQQPGLDVTASLCITTLLDCNYAFVYLSPSLKHEASWAEYIACFSPYSQWIQQIIHKRDQLSSEFQVFEVMERKKN